jgi:antiviral helicase SLH1
MSESLNSAQAQWLEQLETMRKAIAELNLPPNAEREPAYGDDFDLDDDDLSGTASGEDIWDVISNGFEDGYSSDHLDQYPTGQATGTLYDQQWLAEKCADVARRSSGLDAGALKEQISAILSSDSNSEWKRMASEGSVLTWLQMRSCR